MHETAINMDKLEFDTFIKLVTKNLLTLIHARKKYNIFLDLDKHNSIPEALDTAIKTESMKAKELILEEYRIIAQDFVDKKNKHFKAEETMLGAN